MRYSKTCRIDDCISRDAARPHLAHAYLDVEKKHLVATNGYVLAVLPVEVGLGDVTGVIPKDVFKAIHAFWRASPETPTINAGANYLEFGSMKIERPKADVEHILSGDGVERVFPRYSVGDNSTVSVAFNIDLLVACARAIGKKNIRLTIKAKNSSFLDPVLVAPNETTDPYQGPRALLMPTSLALPSDP